MILKIIHIHNSLDPNSYSFPADVNSNIFSPITYVN